MSILRKISFLISFIFLLSTNMSARHIIGGAVSYVCNGNGSYTFTMKIYRDCSDPQAADFDFNAPIAIFYGDDEVPIDNFYVQYQVPVTDIEAPNDNPCIIIPPSVCVQEAIYTFDYTFANWPATEAYTIAYQRCCRNNNITNVLEPQETGATFSTVILPAAQQECNNSPEFDSFPPTVLCAGEPLNFEHSATDPDGDLVIYELCAPYKGGGLAGVLGNPGDPNGCDGVSPDPACHPGSWELIEYVTPYSALNPIGGDPQVVINSGTGLLTGTPNISGQFVVGVCAYEYRNGELMSVLSRDFQFNVVSCDPLVVADVPTDSINGEAVNYYFSCQETTFEFENNSYQESFIDEYFWRFDVNGADSLYYEWEPTVDFPGPGSYAGILVLNPDEVCGDTANILVEIFPETQADFYFDYDTCVSGPVFLTDTSFSASGPIQSWAWDFGNGITDSVQNPYVQYGEAAFYDVSLEVTDLNNCMDDTTITISYFPVPNLIVVSPSAEVTCPPADITFENLSFPVDSTYITNWTFGDGGTDTLISPVHTYDSVGLYTVSLEITSPIGCVTDTTFEDLILVKPPPRADFAYDEKAEWSNFDPDIDLFSLSDNDVFWEWYDNGEKFSLEENPSYVFPDTGLHEVKLLVWSVEGCADSITQVIDVVPQVRYWLPNAFTPNWDTKNDEYGGKGFLRGATNFNMQIWDRWGGLIFESDTPDVLWNGQENNTGRPVPAGTYVCTVTFTGPRGNPFEYKAFAQLIR